MIFFDFFLLLYFIFCILTIVLFEIFLFFLMCFFIIFLFFPHLMEFLLIQLSQVEIYFLHYLA